MYVYIHIHTLYRYQQRKSKGFAAMAFNILCATPMLFFKSELLPVNSCAGIRENLNIVIVGSSNLITDKAHSHPCAFSCQLNKMSLSDWQYPLFSTVVCL